eukprot:COSAG02_NODE_18370_length_943_cov_1.013033_2_plen_268_part_01
MNNREVDDVLCARSECDLNDASSEDVHTCCSARASCSSLTCVSAGGTELVHKPDAGLCRGTQCDVDDLDTCGVEKATCASMSCPQGSYVARIDAENIVCVGNPCSIDTEDLASCCTETRCEVVGAPTLSSRGYVVAGDPNSQTVAGLGAISCNPDTHVASDPGPAASCSGEDGEQRFDLSGCSVKGTCATTPVECPLATHVRKAAYYTLNGTDVVDCCDFRRTCGDKNGDGVFDDPFTTAECGLGYHYDWATSFSRPILEDESDRDAC